MSSQARFELDCLEMERRANIIRLDQEAGMLTPRQARKMIYAIEFELLKKYRLFGVIETSKSFLRAIRYNLPAIILSILLAWYGVTNRQQFGISAWVGFGLMQAILLWLTATTTIGFLVMVSHILLYDVFPRIFRQENDAEFLLMWSNEKSLDNARILGLVGLMGGTFIIVLFAMAMFR